MQRHILSGLALICVAIACGEATLTSSSQSNKTEEKTGGAPQSVQSKTLRSKSSAESTLVKSADDKSYTLTQPLQIAQFGVQTVDVTVHANTPSGSLELQPAAVAGFKIEYLTMSGDALSGPIALDAEAKASFKLRLTSELTPVADVVKAPGETNGQISLRGMDAGQPVTGTVSFKTSNVALVPMNVDRVQDLPSSFEFPAGTIPVFVNPADRDVVSVMHFGGGGAGAAQFKHQSTQGQMPAGRGYCPLNNGTTSVQVDPAQAVPSECLPCPADASASVEGIFYDHNRENSGVQRKIVCLQK